MSTPDTVYRGVRQGDGSAVVTAGGVPLDPRPSQRVRDHAGGFEWGYGGAGPMQLALALLLDALDDATLAREWAEWFLWGRVAAWDYSGWEATAAEIRAWVARGDIRYRASLRRGAAARVRRCRACGCTEDDCRQCVAATGEPCRWVAGEPDLCSRCAAPDAAVVATPARARREGGGR